MLRPHLLIGLLSVFSLTLGCGFQSSQPESEGGQVTFVSLAAIDTLDPQATSWLIDFRVIEGLFEPLLSVDPATVQIEPAAAESMPQVSDDGLTYTFTIRSDAKWSNGDPVKASDYAYGWKRALLADLAADYSGLFFCIEGAEDFFTWRGEALAGFKAGSKTADQLWQQTNQRFADTVGIKPLDDHTLQVKLREPTAYFNELVAFTTFSPIHEKSASPYLELDSKSGAVTMKAEYFKDPSKIVCNGAYHLTQWNFKQRMVLDQNPHYWDKQSMKNTRVVMEVESEETNALLRYDNDEIDWFPNMSTASRTSADLLASGRKDLHYGPAAGTCFYLFNTQPTVNGQPNPLADVRVRRALSMAIDRNHIVKNITRMKQPVSTTFVPPTAIPGYNPPTEAGITFDIKQAKQLLAEAGYPNGQGLNGLSILINSEGEHAHLAQALAFEWREKLGVSIPIETVEKSAFRDRRRNQGFTIARGSWFGDYRDPTTFLDMFRSNDGNNDVKYNNPEYDQLLRSAASTKDPAARFEILREAEAILLHDQPLAPLYTYTNMELFDTNRVSGIQANPWNYRKLDAIEVKTK